MDANSQRQKQQDNVLTLLNVAIEAANLAKEVSSVTPAKVVFGSVGTLLEMVRVRFSSPDDLLQIYMRPGLHGQQDRICRTRASLRRCM